jgi:lipid II:glycine glycyltransferase (peptidoglycan interpeptide bridge formation enzyme)
VTGAAAFSTPPGGIAWRDHLDPLRWDEFVASHPGGGHLQLSQWAAVKRTVGWDSVIAGFETNDGIVGGAAILHRRIPVFGRIGYIPRGPLLDDPDLAPRFVEELTRMASRLGIRHLTVQPPMGGEALEPVMATAGFFPGTAPVAPDATLVVDLARDDDEILGAMSARTRYNVRLFQRRELRLRGGDATDLTAYHHLLERTSKRQGFDPYPLDYYLALWEQLAPLGHIHLFLLERSDELVSAMLAVTFGDTVTNKLAVWSGEHGQDRPNEGLYWMVMQWGKAHGFRRFDLEGIPRPVAEATIAGAEIPEKYRSSVASFKLGFGGTLLLLPGPWIWASSRPVAAAYRKLTEQGRGARMAKRLVNRLRTGGRE